MNATAAQMAARARDAGYETVSIEQPRANRWLMTLRAPAGAPLLVLAQRRALIIAADVHDLAELLRLRRVGAGCLLALDGRFSPEALRAAQELRAPRVQLCLALPAAAAPIAAAPGALETA